MTLSRNVRACNDCNILISGEAAIRGYSEKPTTSNSVSTEATLLPLSHGEYDEPIGLPLVVVCQNVIPPHRLQEQTFNSKVDKMDMLEREMGYKDELFDFIQQFLRTILLKRVSSYKSGS